MLNRKVFLLVVRSASRKDMVRATAKKSIVDDARMGFGMLEEQNRQENIFIIVSLNFITFWGCYNVLFFKSVKTVVKRL